MIKNYLKLTRYPNLIIMILTQLVVVSHCFSILNVFHFTLIVLFSILIAAAGYVVNDIFDQKIDEENKPEKVIVGKIIAEKEAWKFYFALMILPFLTAIYFLIIFHEIKFLILLFLTNFLLFIYAKWLKKSFLLGNIIVSGLCALVPLILLIFEDYLFEGQKGIFLNSRIDFLINMSFLMTFFREIVKDLEDRVGDAKFGAKTMPIVAGTTISKIVAIVPMILLTFQVMSLGFSITKTGVDKIAFGEIIDIIIILPVFMAIYMLFRAKTQEQYHRVSTLAKWLMLLGLLSIVFLNFQN
jgi:4-hydroxybenzoate polyprenyltransferase